MQIATAQCTASDLENDVARLNKLGAGSLDDFNFVLALPHQGLHLVGVVSSRFVVGDILFRDGSSIVANSLLGLKSRL